MPCAWKQHQSILTFCYLVAQTGVRNWDLLITVLRRSTNWATRQLGNVSKILTLIAKHWAREYREKTTPLRIFMPCYLSSCRVVMNLNSTQHSIVNHTTVTILFLISTHRLFNLLCIYNCKGSHRASSITWPVYPRGEKHSREVIFAFLRISKIAKFCAS